MDTSTPQHTPSPIVAFLLSPFPCPSYPFPLPRPPDSLPRQRTCPKSTMARKPNDAPITTYIGNQYEAAKTFVAGQSLHALSFNSELRIVGKEWADRSESIHTRSSRSH